MHGFRLLRRVFKEFPWLRAIVIISWLGFVSLRGAEGFQPIHEVDGSFVREWLVLGPFSAKDLETDFLAEAGGEAMAQPREGDTLTKSDGTKVVWRRLSSETDLVNLEKVLGIQSWSVAYVYCELNYPREAQTDIRIPYVAVPPGRLWINGEELKVEDLHADRVGHLPKTREIWLKAGGNRCLFKLMVDTREWTFSFQPLPPDRATVAMTVMDANGTPVPDAVVQFLSGGENVGHVMTDSSGKAEACLFPVQKSCDVRITAGQRGAWLYDVQLKAGERRNLHAVVKEEISISGRVLALDGSPQNAIIVEALRVSDSTANERSTGGGATIESGLKKIRSLFQKSNFSETVLSDTNGNFRFVNLRPGAYRLRCHGAEGFVNPKGQPGGGDPFIVAPGKTNKEVEFAFSRAKKGRWQNYPITKGLIELNPFSIHRTPEGLLWVGTDDGTLHSYDGVEFKIFETPQIPGHAVETITHDNKGTVWVGTSSGVGRIDGSEFRGWPFDEKLPRSYIYDILPDGDATWLCTKSGLCKDDGTKVVRWGVERGLPFHDVLSFLRARDGTVWVGTHFGLAKSGNGDISQLKPIPMEQLQQIRRIYQAKDGRIWFCSMSEGVFCFDGSEFRRLGKEDGLLSDRVFDVVETADGVIWFGTEQGLSRFNGKTIVNYTMQDGLSNEWVRDIFVDEDHVLWLANGWGISRFNPDGFIGFNHADGFQNPAGDPIAVFEIEPDGEGGFWVGTAWGGLYRVKFNADRPELIAAYPDAGYVRQIYRAENGTLWLGTGAGISKLENGFLTNVLGSSWVIALTGDSQGNLWFGNGWTGGGLSRFNPTTGEKTVFMQAQGIPDEYIWSLEPDGEGGVWIGTGTSVVRSNGEKFEMWNDRLGIPGAAVFDLRRDRNNALWIALQKGLHRREGNQTISITATNGLPDEHVWCSARTADGVIWIGTESYGLVGYDGEATTVLDKRDGLLGNNVFAVEPDSSDSLWVGFLDGGLSRYRRSKMRPAIRLVEASLDNQTLTNLSNLPKAEVGHRITVQYQEIDLKTHPEKRQFRYRLATMDGKTVFSGITKNRRFDWTPTEGGTFQFEVQAIDRDLNYSDPARLTFQAVVPWHANGWVLVPVAGTFGGLVAWAFIARKLYVRKSREASIERERVRIARDLHDHLGAGLTDLALAGDLVRQHLDSSGSAQVLATRLGESARELTRGVGRGHLDDRSGQGHSP